MSIKHKIEQWKKMKDGVNITLDLWNAIRFACNTEGIRLSSMKQLRLARGLIAHYNLTPQQEEKE